MKNKGHHAIASGPTGAETEETQQGVIRQCLASYWFCKTCIDESGR